MGPGKMQKLPDHVPFFTHFPPISIPFSSIFLSCWNIFTHFPRCTCTNFPFPPFSPISRTKQDTEYSEQMAASNERHIKRHRHQGMGQLEAHKRCVCT